MNWFSQMKLALLMMLFASLGLAQTRNMEQGDVMFLRIREDDKGSFRLIELDHRPGTLKASADRHGGIRYRFSTLSGEIISEGFVADPRSERLDAVDFVLPAGFETVQLPLKEFQREFTVRLPGQAGADFVDLWSTQHRDHKLEHIGFSGDHENLIGRFDVNQPSPLISTASLSRQNLGGASFQVLKESGSKTNRINIVVLSEGYQATELPQFKLDALKVGDYLLKTPPWNDYTNHYNLYAISVASTDSGSDHPSTGIFKETFFNSTYNSFGIDRLLTIPPNDRNSNYDAGQGRVLALLKQFLPDYDLALMLVNDKEYGGSGGIPAIASLNTSSSEILVHEVGHSYAGLGDEYDTPFPGYPDIEEPNTTRETDRNSIKWRDWILSSTPVPTPEENRYSSVVGLFEGAHFHTTGWFRPKFNCKMKSLGVPFCEVCSEAHILKHYRLINPIEGSTPPSGVLSLIGNVTTNLVINILQPSNHSLGVEWYLSGVKQNQATGSSFVLNSGSLGNGNFELRAEVRDRTSRVRRDVQGNLSRTNSWLVSIRGVTPTIRVGPVSLLASGAVTISVESEELLNVILESSDDLIRWAEIGRVTQPTTKTTLTDSRPLNGSSGRYFRARRN